MKPYCYIFYLIAILKSLFVITLTIISIYLEEIKFFVRECFFFALNQSCWMMNSKISGPGCSSIGGETLELGPFFPQKAGTKPLLRLNPYSWNKGRIIFRTSIYMTCFPSEV